ncbi:MAG: DUF1236 domain-containing protein [Sediminimonas sp.]|uniref:DUF1236 domain-containing protein n=1 Tax=Sediminimonas sp. TaxID=2823379 RepID=UPI0028704409|nr:DUF1236 domain-containing protein [Sediminimonas sp.]MDR9486205.1 DUF1236 domain-containing protein [Sediminimonas sp.]
MYTRSITLAVTALGLAAAPALAAPTVQAVTDLNLRAGPGPRFEIISVIDQEASAEIQGCLENGSWCKVSYNGDTGWAYGEYLTGKVAEDYIPVVSQQTTIETGTVTYENEDHSGAVIGSGSAGALAGAIVGGPVGAVAGAIAGGAAGAAVEPKEEVVSYVRTNKVEPVYLEGEVVTGVQLPDTVQLQEIPDSEYRYVYVNGAPVLVEPENRTVVHIAR